MPRHELRGTLAGDVHLEHHRSRTWIRARGVPALDRQVALERVHGLPLRTQATSINTPMNPTDRHTEKLKLRESLTAEIVADVEQEIDDELAWAQDNLTEKERKAIRDEVIAQTRRVTDALTTEELQNEGARRAYTCGALATTRQMINLRVAQTKRD